mmetsp:Transcript_19860/g.65666  ORF Transcript_19860/g.65666 Transcript_19860/m.65666 type:complete len:364 (+) Transcript_19860:664-1755(+)
MEPCGSLSPCSPATITSTSCENGQPTDRSNASSAPRCHCRPRCAMVIGHSPIPYTWTIRSSPNLPIARRSRSTCSGPPPTTTVRRCSSASPLARLAASASQSRWSIVGARKVQAPAQRGSSSWSTSDGSKAAEAGTTLHAPAARCGMWYMPEACVRGAACSMASSGRTACRSVRKARLCARRFSWESTAAFGRPVVPEVKKSHAGEPASTAATRSSSACAGAPSSARAASLSKSDAYHCSSPTRRSETPLEVPPACSTASSTVDCSLPSAKTARALERPRQKAISFACSLALSGATVSPACRQPQKTSKKAGTLCIISATVSPAERPCSERSVSASCADRRESWPKLWWTRFPTPTAGAEAAI